MQYQVNDAENQVTLKHQTAALYRRFNSHCIIMLLKLAPPPEGCYSAGLPTEVHCFSWQCLKLLRNSALASSVLSWDSVCINHGRWWGCIDGSGVKSTALAERPRVWFPQPHNMAHSFLWLQFQGIQNCLLTSTCTALMYPHTYAYQVENLWNRPSRGGHKQDLPYQSPAFLPPCLEIGEGMFVLLDESCVFYSPKLIAQHPKPLSKPMPFQIREPRLWKQSIT